MNTEIKNARNEQVYKSKEFLKEIAKVFNIDSQFIPLLDSIEKAEIFNIAGKPTSWGHLRHSINVYWLGYYLLNNDFF